MGAGNACVHGEYEGLFYIDWDNFSSEYEDDYGEIITDYDMQRDDFKSSLYEFKDSFMEKYPSFSKCEKWISNQEKAVLENKLFYIAIEDNQWSMAIKLIQKEQDYYDNGNLNNLQKRHYQNYLDGIRDTLFEQFEELGTYGGAWTSGRIKKSEIAA